jgi:hypothetical protein
MKNLMLLSLLGVCLVAVPSAQAQPVVFGVGVGVGPVYVGPPPVCPYGYYAYYPYACAPYGYYGPEWFSGGIFIGAGPWFHGFHGRGGYYGRPGFYGRPGVAGHSGYYGRSTSRGGPVARGPAHSARGPVGGGYRGGFARGGSARGGFHGGGHR